MEWTAEFGKYLSYFCLFKWDVLSLKVRSYGILSSIVDKWVIPLVACDGLGSSKMMTALLTRLRCWSLCRNHSSLLGMYSMAQGSSDRTAVPHWEITQRWDLMALRLSGSQKPTSDPQPWPLVTPPILQGPVYVIGHLSNSSHWSDYRPIWDLPTTHFLDPEKRLSATLHDNKSPDCCRKSKGTSICSMQGREWEPDKKL